MKNSYYCCFAISSFTWAVVTLQESVMAVWLFAVVYPAGRFPATEKLKESLLGSCAVIDILAEVFTVTFTSVGPTKIFGGKFSAKQTVQKIPTHLKSRKKKTKQNKTKTKTNKKTLGQGDHRLSNSCCNRHLRDVANYSEKLTFIYI